MNARQAKIAATMEAMDAAPVGTFLITAYWAPVLKTGKNRWSVVSYSSVEYTTFEVASSMGPTEPWALS